MLVPIYLKISSTHFACQTIYFSYQDHIWLVRNIYTVFPQYFNSRYQVKLNIKTSEIEHPVIQAGCQDIKCRVIKCLDIELLVLYDWYPDFKKSGYRGTWTLSYQNTSFDALISGNWGTTVMQNNIYYAISDYKFTVNGDRKTWILLESGLFMLVLGSSERNNIE